jgi:hypothetical protein
LFNSEEGSMHFATKPKELDAQLQRITNSRELVELMTNDARCLQERAGQWSIIYGQRQQFATVRALLMREKIFSGMSLIRSSVRRRSCERALRKTGNLCRLHSLFARISNPLDASSTTIPSALSDGRAKNMAGVPRDSGHSIFRRAYAAMVCQMLKPFHSS